MLGKNFIRATLMLLSCFVSVVGVSEETPKDTAQPTVKEVGAKLYNFENRSRVPGQFIVVFKSEEKLATVPLVGEGAPRFAPELSPTSKEGVEALSSAMAERVKGSVEKIFTKRDDFHAFSLREVSDDDVKALLADDPRIEYIEAVLPIKVDTIQDLPASEGLDRIDQRLLPLNQKFAYGATGKNVTVHLVDSGMTVSHPEFEGRAGKSIRFCPYLDFYSHETEYGDDDECADIDRHRLCKTYNSTEDPYLDICDISGPWYWPSHQDSTGHGTMIASAIGGKTFGVAKEVTFKPYAFNIHRIPPISSDIVMALEEVLDHLSSSPNIVNLSLGTACEPGEECFSPSLDNAVQALINARVTVVVAGGNEDQEACLRSPARMSKTSAVITVGASTLTDGRWWYGANQGSNYGSCISLWAPSVGTVAQKVGIQPPGDELFYEDVFVPNGATSLATAYTSGAAALWLSTHATDTPAQVKTGLVAAATSGVLNSTHPTNGIQTGSPNKLLYSGFAPGTVEAYHNPDGNPIDMLIAVLGIINTVHQLLK